MSASLLLQLMSISLLWYCFIALPSNRRTVYNREGAQVAAPHAADDRGEGGPHDPRALPAGEGSLRRLAGRGGVRAHHPPRPQHAPTPLSPDAVSAYALVRWTALMYASAMGHAEAVDMLLDEVGGV